MMILLISIYHSGQIYNKFQTFPDEYEQLSSCFLIVLIIKMNNYQVEGNLIQQFDKIYENHIITQWAQAYISYPSLLYYLNYFKNVYDRHHQEFFRHRRHHIELLPIEPQLKDNLQTSLSFTQEVLQSGQQKYSSFIKYKTEQIIYYWLQVIEIVIKQQQEMISSHQIYQKRVDIKLLLKIIYANINHLRIFKELNLKIVTICNYAKEKYVLPFRQPSSYIPAVIQSQEKADIDKNLSVNGYIQLQEVNYTDSSSQVKLSILKHQLQEDNFLLKGSFKEDKYLNMIENATKQLYSSIIYLNKYEESKLAEFCITKSKVANNKNYFLLGLYIGLGIVIMIAMFILLVLNFISISNNEERIDSMNYIFPMFRGVGLLILYLWGMAWNVYGFTVYKINFRNILEYGSHYSNHFQIMKRAGFFTLLYCFMLFAYLLGLQLNQQLKTQIPVEYAPFIVWTIYFAYIFFPNREVFNPRGRKFFYLLIKKIALSPVVKMTFLLSFASDQLVSFVVPIKDFAYTICYYTSELEDRFKTTQISQCLKSDNPSGIIIAYIVALVPLVIRMIQCYNQAKQSSGKFRGHIQMWNFFKYTSSVVTATLSFLTSVDPNFLIFFIISSIFSTSYSYYWDLKYDWGFLEPKAKHFYLRNHLCYKKPALYYFAILINLVFRCSWTLTISPSVVKLIPKSTFLPFLTGFIQIMRRCMWNFFRIEKEHVINCASFSIIKDKPADIIKRIKAVNRTKQFVVNDGQSESSIINCIKLENDKELDHYKKILNIQLPQINEEMIEGSLLDFKQKLAKEKEKINLWQKDNKKHIFYDVLDKFY